MKFPSSLFLRAYLAAALALVASPVLSQDRLPATIRGNSNLSGQVYGCSVRLEEYYRLTIERARASGRNLPAGYQLNLIAGLNVSNLKGDALQALLVHLAGTVPIAEFDVMLLELAGAEYDATSVGAPGYNESWSQAAACSNLFRQFDLFAIYP